MNNILFLLSFIISAFLAFYIPGRVVIGNQKNLSTIGTFAVSFILGIVLWGWQGYIFGFLHLRWLSYLYLFVFLVFFIKGNYFLFKIPKNIFRRTDWLSLLVIIIGIFGQIIPYVKNGQLTAQGLFFSTYNATDHIWHATLIDELIKRFPPYEPGMFGVLLTNYHFWFNLVTADLIRVFRLPLFQTQFIGMYCLGSMLFALIAYALATSLYKSKLFLRLFLFFSFFSGNLGAWFMLFAKHRFDFNLDWLFEDSSKLMDAPGSGLAVIISLAAFYLLFKNKKQISVKNILIIALLFGSLMGFKIYYAISFIFGLFCFAVFKILKKNLQFLWVFLASGVIFLCQFLPFNSSSGGLFFLPFNIPREFMAQNALGLSFFDQRWSIFFHHNNYPRLIEYGIIMSILYFIAQFGVKLFGLILLKRTIKTVGTDFFILLYSSLICSIVIGLFFYQRVGGANIWEFFLATSLILSILLSLNLSLYLPKEHKIETAIILIVIAVITLPRWGFSVKEYVETNFFTGFHGITKIELACYDYLKKNTPTNSELLYLDSDVYLSTSSLDSIFTQRNLFFSGIGVSQLATPEIERRKRDFEIIKNNLDVKKINEVLKKDNINYIYLQNSTFLQVSTISGNGSLRKVFSNKWCTVFKVN